MKHSRLIWVDSLKGWLIMLVVLGHAIQNTLGETCYTNHLWNIVYSFHMAAFMAVSGYVAFRPGGDLGRNFICNTIWRRFKQLIVPFTLWTFISQVINGRIDIEIFGLYLLYPDRGLWFLWVLFFINIIFLSGSYLAEKIKVGQGRLILCLCLFLVAMMVLFEIRVFGFQFIAYYFLFYSFGYFFHKYNYCFVLNNCLILILLGVCWAFMAWFWNMHELPTFMRGLPLPETITQYAYRFITAALAVYLLLVLSPRILNSPLLWNRPFVKIGIISLGIYAIHFMFLGIWIGLFRGMGLGDDIVIVFTFISTLIVSWIVVWLLSKWKVTATWLLGKI